jgi:tetratricopeptide (TPR) repeat protein
MECYQKTLTELEQAIAQNPNDVRAIAHRGETYRLMERYEEALGYFDRAIELKPDYYWAIAHRGETYRLMERYEEALAEFGRAIKLKLNYAWALAHQGVCYYQLKRYQQAWKNFDRAIQLNSDYAWTMIYRSQLYALENRYEEALVDFDRGISLDQNIIPSWHGERGLLLSYLGRYAEAIECCEQGLEKNSKDYITLYTLAIVKARWKGIDAAKIEIDKTRSVLQAIGNPKGRADILYRLGGLAALEGKPDEALRFLQEAIWLENEPLELARRDLAWLDLRHNLSFQLILSKTYTN